MPALLFRERRQLPQGGEVRCPAWAGVWCAVVVRSWCAVALWVRAGWRMLELYMLRTVRRAAEGEPPLLEGWVPVHQKTLVLVASTVSHSPAFPRRGTYRRRCCVDKRRPKLTSHGDSRVRARDPAAPCAVKFEGRSSFSLPRPRPNWQAPRAAGAQSDGLVHIGFNLKPLLARSFSLCLLYTSPSPRDGLLSRMPSSA